MTIFAALTDFRIHSAYTKLLEGINSNFKVEIILLATASIAIRNEVM